jgi:hypothetical protein
MSVSMSSPVPMRTYVLSPAAAISRIFSLPYGSVTGVGREGGEEEGGS